MRNSVHIGDSKSFDWQLRHSLDFVPELSLEVQAHLSCVKKVPGQQTVKGLELVWHRGQNSTLMTLLAVICD